MTLDTFDEYAGFLGVDAQALVTGEPSDELPGVRVGPDDANPMGRRKR